MKVLIIIATVLSVLTAAHGQRKTERITLPFGQTAETIYPIRGSNYLVSSLLSGNVLMVDVRSKLVTTVVRAPANRTIQGITYFKEKNWILGASSGAAVADIVKRFISLVPNRYGFFMPAYPAAMHIYNAETGKPVVSCPVINGNSINDVAVTKNRRFAYFTESVFNQIYRLDLTAIPDCKIKTFKTPEAFTDKNLSELYGAGIATHRNGLILSNFQRQSIYFYNLKTRKFNIIVPENKYGNMDGVRIVGKCLLAVAAYQNRVNIFRLGFKNGKVTAKFTRFVADDSLSDPTSAVIRGRRMYVINNDVVTLGNTTDARLWISSIPIPPVRKLC